MKHNHNHDNTTTPASNSCPSALNSRIRRPRPFASREPSTTGSPKPRRCIPPALGNWWKETALAPGTYEYCLVVDGQWIPDPLARESVANPFGGRNSILKVASSPEAAHLADAENLPLKNANKPKTQKYEQRNTSNQQ